MTNNKPTPPKQTTITHSQVGIAGDHTPDERSIARTIGTFDTVVNRIQSQDFAIPERPAKLCEDCDMRYYCDTKNWRFR
jgi:hypothetical protein